MRATVVASFPNEVAEYFRDFVVDALRKYELAERVLTAAVILGQGDPAEASLEALRAARNAAIWLHQFSDKVATSMPRSPAGNTPEAVRKWLTKTHMPHLDGMATDEVEILHAVADAFKHSELRSTSRKVKSDRCAIVVGSGFGAMRYSEGKYGGCDQVVVLLNDGRACTLLLVLTLVADAWRAALGLERALPSWYENYQPMSPRQPILPAN